MYIKNPTIFWTRDIFRTLSRHILAYSEHSVKLVYWKPCHIQNFTIFRILAYLRPEAYSVACRTSKMQGLMKLVKVYNYSSTKFHLSCLTRFSTRLCLSIACLCLSILLSYLRLYTTHFFYISNTRLKLAKNQAKAKQHPEAELLLFEKYSHSLSILSSKNNKKYSEKWLKKQVCMFL